MKLKHMRSDAKLRAAALVQQQGLIPAEQPASGPRGKKRLKTAFGFRDLIVRDKQFACAQASFDWHNDRLQILVFDSNDDPALHVRYNPDGTIAEIVIRDDLLHCPIIKAASREPSQEPSLVAINRFLAKNK